MAFIFIRHCVGEVDHAVEGTDCNSGLFVLSCGAVVDVHMTECSDLVDPIGRYATMLNSI